jgi:hypothetical protein
VVIDLQTPELTEKDGKGRKLDQQCDGPFEIMEQISPVTCHLQLTDNYLIHPIINIAHLERYTPSPEEFSKQLIKPPK